MKKPDKCCKIGSYDHQIPMPLGGRRQDIDLCVADIVAALNAANIRTVASCCGHGEIDGSIVLKDNRELVIRQFDHANYKPYSTMDIPKDKEYYKAALEIEQEEHNASRQRIAELEAELVEYEWVSVEDRLPEESGWYAVYDGSEWNRAYYTKPNNWIKDCVCIKLITHWKSIHLPGTGSKTRKRS